MLVQLVMSPAALERRFLGMDVWRFALSTRVSAGTNNVPHLFLEDEEVVVVQQTSPVVPTAAARSGPCGGVGVVGGSLVCEAVVPLGSVPIASVRDNTEIHIAFKKILADNEHNGTENGMSQSSTPVRPVYFNFPVQIEGQAEIDSRFRCDLLLCINIKSITDKIKLLFTRTG